MAHLQAVGVYRVSALEHRYGLGGVEQVLQAHGAVVLHAALEAVVLALHATDGFWWFHASRQHTDVPHLQGLVVAAATSQAVEEPVPAPHAADAAVLAVILTCSSATELLQLCRGQKRHDTCLQAHLC